MNENILQIALVAVLLLNPLALLYILSKSKGTGHGLPTAGKKKIIVDTCALIDGRLIEVMRAGFVPGQLLIPRAVIAELQHLADQADPYKRERARFGLDIVKELQLLSDNGVVILNDDRTDDQLVDDLLVELAQKHGAMLYTTDYNLNKVAEIKGVTVLNVNELAQGLRAQYLPGETMTIKLVQKGQDQSQGVGYLPDGTMVVVENSAKYIGQTITVTFSRVLQTQAGKMMFAKLASGAQSRKNDKPAQKSRQMQPVRAEQGVKPRSMPGVQQSTAARKTQRPKNKSPEDSLLESVQKYAR